jgi:uncharacterized RDD family membrane protein YckC
MKRLFRTCISIVGITLVAVGAESLDTTSTGLAAVVDTASAASPGATTKHVGDMIRIGAPGLLRENEVCKDAVIIGNSAVIRGKVQGDLVVVGGSADVSNKVDGNLVVVGGTATLSPAVRVGGDLVLVGGRVMAPDDLFVGGQRVEVAPFLGGAFGAFNDYLRLCIFKARFISEQLPWTIALFGLNLLLGFALSMLFQKTFSRAVSIIYEKPGIAFLIGICAAIATGPVVAVLAATVIGIPAIPALIIMLWGLGLIGKTAVLAGIGRQTTSAFGRPAAPIAGQVVIGSLIFVALAMVPWIGILVVILLGTFGAGAGVYGFFERSREARHSRASIRSKPVGGAAAPAKIVSVPPIQRNPHTPPSADAVTPTETAASEGAASLPPAGIREAESETLAGMWPRLGAVCIDAILVFMLYNLTIGNLIGADKFVHVNHEGAARIVCLLIYLAAFWSWKSTTIGNIVFHLQVRHLDDSRITPSVAILRALSLILSVAPLGLGFFWIQWDPNRQGWHDTIADTKVVRLSRSVPLI